MSAAQPPDDRLTYLARQRADAGRPTVAILPIHTPRELIEGLGAVAAEVWGPPGVDATASAAALQSYICSLAHRALAFLHSSVARHADAVVVPHTCDTLKSLGTLVRELDELDQPVFSFELPRRGGAAAERFLVAELRRLASGLAAALNISVNDGALTEAIAAQRRAEEQRRSWAELHRRGGVDLRSYIDGLRRGEWLRAEDHARWLEDAQQRADRVEPADGVVPLAISGIVPEPDELIDVLADLGVRLVVDDYASGGRRLTDPRAGLDAADPFVAIAQRLMARPPCPTRGTALELRVDSLVARCKLAGARGLLLHLVGFCEPELFDVPALQQAMAQAALPVLVLETELSNRLPQAAVTRIEAFVELLEAQK